MHEKSPAQNRQPDRKPDKTVKPAVKSLDITKIMIRQKLSEAIVLRIILKLSTFEIS